MLRDKKVWIWLHKNYKVIGKETPRTKSKAKQAYMTKNSPFYSYVKAPKNKKTPAAQSPIENG